MSWIETVTKLSAAAALAVLGTAGVAAATLVVRSNGPSAASYPPGKSLPADGSIALKAGDSVTVLDARGTRVLRGPGTLPVVGGGAASESSFTALLANSGARQSRTGATRGTGGPVHPTNVWYVDASRGGAKCVADPRMVTLWRPSADAAGGMTITRLSDGRTATVDFREGQSVHPWPVADLPVTEGASFRLMGAGLAGPVTITTTLLPDAPAGLDGVARALLAKNCAAQVDLLVSATSQDTGG